MNLDLSVDQGLSWTTLAAGLGLDGFGRGSYLWTAGPETDGNTALIRRPRQDGSRPEDVSDAAFLIANAGTDYYVNDGSRDGDVLTTAPGDNAASGKTPAQPMTSLTSLLAAYDLDPGDVIHVDTGTHRLIRNIVIAAQDGGVRIAGPVTDGAVLDRGGNQTSGAYVIELQDADDVTLDHLAITGGVYGIYAVGGSDSDRLTLTDSDIYGNYFAGLYLGPSNEQALLQRQPVPPPGGHGPPGGSAREPRSPATRCSTRTAGSRSATPRALVLGNEVYNNTLRDQRLRRLGQPAGDPRQHGA